ncbi:microcin ABC transporter permease, partial [Desulfococcaceae bacterium OttesenSCG-928-F15]|nr:microcin ABC transporter permease [Desulfococcaceae bacterium OttesenSCG-928-F15]
MFSYILRRLLLIVPTLLGILTINFFVIQAAPGGPVEQMILRLEGDELSSGRTPGGGASENLGRGLGDRGQDSRYRGAQGLDPEFIRRIEAMYGFDKPIHVRYFKMLKDYLCFDFGESFYRSTSVLKLIGEKLPVSISLGIWSTLIIYLVSIPLGITKALRHGSRFDAWTS